MEAATTRDQVSRQILDYSKADVKAIRQELKSVNWQNLFENLSADQLLGSLQRQTREFAMEIYTGQMSAKQKTETNVDEQQSLEGS